MLLDENFVVKYELSASSGVRSALDSVLGPEEAGREDEKREEQDEPRGASRYRLVS